MKLSEATRAHLAFLGKMLGRDEEAIVADLVAQRAESERAGLRKLLEALDAGTMTAAAYEWTDVDVARMRALAETRFPND